MAVIPIDKRRGFDWMDERRGFYGRLINGARRTVVLTEWPGTLMAMLRAKVLDGVAKADAEAIAQAWTDEYGPER